jgi:hypothetical protein
LPSHAAALGDDVQVAFSHRRRRPDRKHRRPLNEVTGPST